MTRSLGGAGLAYRLCWREADRIHIAERLRENASLRQIAAELNRSPSTIVARGRLPLGLSAARRPTPPAPKPGKIGQNPGSEPPTSAPPPGFDLLDRHRHPGARGAARRGPGSGPGGGEARSSSHRHRPLPRPAGRPGNPPSPEPARARNSAELGKLAESTT
ncbi:helix-turn-helix domain-containing protein [Streptomyces shenzhenensis]|uniref:helix-turn-helix domain-containing protein n=1 Tax=Streptomyces shenzhenensis TaxID=943815 RepID=UPI0037DA14AC